MASPPLTFSYTTLRIPTKTPRLSEQAEKFRAAKLSALQKEPTAFATKYEDEVLLPTPAWISRITAKGTETLICVATREPRSETDNDEEFLMSGDWVGMLTLRGPFALSDFYLPESGQPVSSFPEKETRWHMAALYTDPSHRGKGLAKKLINSAIDFGKEYSRTQGDDVKARFRLFVHPDNKLAVGLYEGMGFIDAGRVTLVEAFVAKGDRALIPADSVEEEGRIRWHRRLGLAMERVV